MQIGWSCNQSFRGGTIIRFWKYQSLPRQLDRMGCAEKPELNTNHLQTFYQNRDKSKNSSHFIWLSKNFKTISYIVIKRKTKYFQNTLKSKWTFTQNIFIVFRNFHGRILFVAKFGTDLWLQIEPHLRNVLDTTYAVCVHTFRKK